MAEVEVKPEAKIKKFKCLYKKMPTGNDDGRGTTMSLTQTIEAAYYEVRGNTIVFLDGLLTSRTREDGSPRQLGENVLAKLPNKDMWEITEI